MLDAGCILLTYRPTMAYTSPTSRTHVNECFLPGTVVQAFYTTVLVNSFDKPLSNPSGNTINLVDSHRRKLQFREIR